MKDYTNMFDGIKGLSMLTASDRMLDGIQSAIDAFQDAAGTAHAFRFDSAALGVGPLNAISKNLAGASEAVRAAHLDGMERAFHFDHAALGFKQQEAISKMVEGATDAARALQLDGIERAFRIDHATVGFNQREAISRMIEGANEAARALRSHPATFGLARLDVCSNAIESATQAAHAFHRQAMERALRFDHANLGLEQVNSISKIIDGATQNIRVDAGGALLASFSKSIQSVLNTTGVDEALSQTTAFSKAIRSMVSGFEAETRLDADTGHRVPTEVLQENGIDVSASEVGSEVHTPALKKAKASTARDTILCSIIAAVFWDLLKALVCILVALQEQQADAPRPPVQIERQMAATTASKVVTRDRLRVYKGKSTRSNVLHKLQFETPIRVQRKVRKWLYISYTDPVEAFCGEGWILSRYATAPKKWER